mmetsp:Transcript_1397/g.2840  ORF Transcript_1397/g.2840 Transcript_1397/m.2840 type:complete len:192 (+) Transcript_1397:1288-1863(+)
MGPGSWIWSGPPSYIDRMDATRYVPSWNRHCFYFCSLRLTPHQNMWFHRHWNHYHQMFITLFPPASASPLDGIPCTNQDSFIWTIAGNGESRVLPHDIRLLNLSSISECPIQDISRLFDLGTFNQRTHTRMKSPSTWAVEESTVGSSMATIQIEKPCDVRHLQLAASMCRSLEKREINCRSPKRTYSEGWV